MPQIQKVVEAIESVRNVVGDRARILAESWVDCHVSTTIHLGVHVCPRRPPRDGDHCHLKGLVCGYVRDPLSHVIDWMA